MKKHAFITPVSLLAGIFVLGLSFWLVSPAAATSGYRIRYRHCSIETDLNRSIVVKDSTSRASYVKIQYVKMIPSWVTFNGAGTSTNAPAGTVYMTEPLTIPSVAIGTDLGTFYSEARVMYLACSGSVSQVRFNKTWADIIESGRTFGSLKVSAQANSTLSEYATMVMGIYGASPSAPMPVQLSGVILENTIILNVPLTSVKVSSKKCRTTLPLQDKTFVSMAGIGRVTPEALADASGKYNFVTQGVDKLRVVGANIVPNNLLSHTAIPSIQAVSARLDGSRRGGTIGLSLGLLPQSEFGAPSFGTIYGDVGVYGYFWAGPQGYADIPFHQGTIQKIATHPRKGLLLGTAHVMPTNEIKFVPKDHPLFVVCDDPGAAH